MEHLRMYKNVKDAFYAAFDDPLDSTIKRCTWEYIWWGTERCIKDDECMWDCTKGCTGGCTWVAPVVALVDAMVNA